MDFTFKYKKVSQNTFDIQYSFIVHCSHYSQKSYFGWAPLIFPNMCCPHPACAGAGVMHGSEQLGVLARAEVICGHLS